MGGNSGGKKKTIYNHFVSAAVKMAKHPLASCILFAYVYLMCYHIVNFPLFLIHQMPRELFTADLVMAQRCSNNYVNNFHFRIHTHIHTFTYIYLEIQANTNTMKHMCVYTAGKHTKWLGKKLFIFSPLFATFVLALGLSACLGVTKMKEGAWRNKKKKSTFFLSCSAKQICLLLLLFQDTLISCGHKGRLHFWSF